MIGKKIRGVDQWSKIMIPYKEFHKITSNIIVDEDGNQWVNIEPCGFLTCAMYKRKSTGETAKII
jgi:hypothetical protein